MVRGTPYQYDAGTSASGIDAVLSLSGSPTAGKDIVLRRMSPGGVAVYLPKAVRVDMGSYPEAQTSHFDPVVWMASQEAELRSEVARLMEQVTQLEEEVEAILTSFANQEFRILDGYIVAIWPALDAPFSACCPKLSAVAQGNTPEETFADLREAMNISVSCWRDSGNPIPLRDVEG